MELKIKDMNTQYLGQRLTMEGTVFKTETQYPFCTQAVFQCQRCGYTSTVEQRNLKFEKPIGGCQNDTCGRDDGLRFMPEKSYYINAQDIEIFDYADDGFKYSDPRKVELKVILLGDAVGKTHLEQKFRFTGRFATTEIGRSRLEYLLYADTVESVPTEEELKKIAAQGAEHSERNKIRAMKEIIKRLSEKYQGAKAPLEEVYAEAIQQGIDKAHAEALIKKMKQRGDLLAPDQNNLRIIN